MRLKYLPKEVTHIVAHIGYTKCQLLETLDSNKVVCQSYHGSVFIGNHCNSLQNSVAKYISNKMPRRFQNFLICIGNMLAKKPVEDSAESIVYYVSNLGISPWAMIWFYNS